MERTPLRTWFGVWAVLKNLLGGSSLVMTSSICWRNNYAKFQLDLGHRQMVVLSPARNFGLSQVKTYGFWM